MRAPCLDTLRCFVAAFIVRVVAFMAQKLDALLVAIIARGPLYTSVDFQFSQFLSSTSSTGVYGLL